MDKKDEVHVHIHIHIHIHIYTCGWCGVKSTASHLDKEDIEGQHRAVASWRAWGERLIGRSQRLCHQHTDSGKEAEQGGSHPKQIDDDSVLQIIDH